MPSYISVITDEEKLLTKHFSLDDSGTLIKTAPQHLTKGTIETHYVSPAELQDLIEKMEPQQCLCLGVLEEPGVRPITCSALQKNGSSIRSKDFLGFFPGQHYLLLDMDDSGLTPEEALNVLAKVDPQFATASLLHVPSSSSYLYDGDKPLVEGANFHFYVELKGVRDSKDYGLLLFDRLILAGLGKPYVTAAGTVVVKTIFDKAVLSPEREIFAAPPICKPPLVSKRIGNLTVQPGPVLDADLLLPLNEDEKVLLRLKISEMRQTVEAEATAKRKAHNEKRAKASAKLKGTNHLVELANLASAPVLYDKQGRPIMELLSSDIILDEQGNEILIRDLILEPQVGLRLPDPLEPYKRGDERRGIPGKGIATMLKENMIFSHHHSGQIFLLRWSPKDLLDFFGSEIDKETKNEVWKAVSSGVMELSAATTEADISELADAVKEAFHNYKPAHVPKEKKHVVSKLRAPAAPDDTEDEALLKMNAEYGLAKIDGKVVIISERWSSESESFEVQYSTPPHLETWTRNRPMKVSFQNQPVSLYRWWEHHPERLQYEDVLFDPNPHTFRKSGERLPMPQIPVYNLFRGYIYEPEKATSCDRIIDHIKQVWCSGNEDEYRYAFSWLASMFQRPKSVSITALVLQSVPGAGKGIIIDNILVKTMGVHAISTSNSEDLTGRFNAHLGINLFFYANELSYTAQASVKSILKTLLTDADRMIEAKNVNKIKSKNYSSVIFSSNNDWMLNIDAGDRRYAYLSVSSAKVGDKQYFVDLKKEIDNGGREAFIKWLLEYDLKGWSPMDIPDISHRQRKADFLRSAHPAVRMCWSLMDIDVEPVIFANNLLYTQIKTWREGGIELSVTKAQFFEMFVDYCTYYQVPRLYDDASNVSLQLESGGLLRRESDPRTDFVIDRRKDKTGRSTLVFKPVEEARKYLRV